MSKASQNVFYIFHVFNVLKLGTSNMDSRLNFIKRGSVGYSASGGSDVHSLKSCDKSLYLELRRGCCYQIWALRAAQWLKLIGHLSIGDSNVTAFWSMINLCISNYRGHRSYDYPLKCFGRHQLHVSNILW